MSTEPYIKRRISYGVTAISTATSGYLLSKGDIGAAEVVLIDSVTVAVLVLAGVKAGPEADLVVPDLQPVLAHSLVGPGDPLDLPNDTVPDPTPTDPAA